MKPGNLLLNIFLTFWFVWFAIGGIVVTAFISWIAPGSLGSEDILVTGATIGIFTGGVAAVSLYLIGKNKRAKGFGDHLPFDRFVKHRPFRKPLQF